ncbi:MAG: hypothetical protein ABL872_12285 [Lacibacter sp.]
MSFSVMLNSGCHSTPDRQKLQRLVELTKSYPDIELCTDSLSFNGDNSIEIQNLLYELGYNCCRLNIKATQDIEDSLLILIKRKSLEVQTLYFDFSNKKRELKTWDYPNASDKRVKVEAKIYLQTTGFD